MTAVFISHRSADSEHAIAVAAALRRCGFASLFLDIDPHAGIVAGTRWDEMLFDRMHRARAVVVVHTSTWAASHWCFAEATHALALGRPVIPVRFDDSPTETPIDRLQWIDARRGRPFDAALIDALTGAGLRRHVRTEPWPPGLSPYPGLRPLGRDDGDVLFGRAEEIQRVLERLNTVRHAGRPALVVLLGPSGTGKSSMMLAGVLPRLRANAIDWEVLNTIRPSASDPPAGEAAFARQSVGSGVTPWRLQPIDQLEEVLNLQGTDAARRWLTRCREGLSVGHAMALATLRTDELKAMDEAARAAGLALELIVVPELGADGLRESIEGPAELAGIALEDGLAGRMISDCVDGKALPMLAFTLAAMFDRSAPPRRFTRELYVDRLGGIQGSVQRCVDAALPPDTPQTDVERLFLRLVRLNEGGEFVRRTAGLHRLPPELAAIVKPLVDVHVLVTGVDAEGRSDVDAATLDRDRAADRRNVEVAHEAVFTHWQRLRDVLDSRRDFLDWRRRFDFALAEWRHHGAELSRPLLDGLDKWQRAGLLDLESDEHDWVEQSRREHRRGAVAVRLTSGLRMVAAMVAACVLAPWTGSLALVFFATSASASVLPQMTITLAALGLGGAVAGWIGLPNGCQFAVRLGLAFFWLGAANAAFVAALPGILAWPLLVAQGVALWRIAAIVGDALWPAPDRLWRRVSIGLVLVLCGIEVWLNRPGLEWTPFDSVLSSLGRESMINLVVDVAVALLVVGVAAAILRPVPARVAPVIRTPWTTWGLRGSLATVVLLLSSLVAASVAAEMAWRHTERVESAERDLTPLAAAQEVHFRRERRYADSLDAFLEARNRWNEHMRQQCRSGLARPEMLEELNQDRDAFMGIHKSMPIGLWVVHGTSWRVGLQHGDGGDLLCVAGNGPLPATVAVPPWAQRWSNYDTKRCNRSSPWLQNLLGDRVPPAPPPWSPPLGCDDLLRE